MVKYLYAKIIYLYFRLPRIKRYTPIHADLKTCLKVMKRFKLKPEEARKIVDKKYLKTRP